LQISFTPKAQADVIIEYKSPLSTNSTEIQIKMHGKRYAERYQNIQKHFGHRFVPKIFKSPKVCSTCEQILWYFVFEIKTKSNQIGLYLFSGVLLTLVFNVNVVIMLYINIVFNKLIDLVKEEIIVQLAK